ncbi:MULTISPECIES: hypothetical protein [Halomonas]|uniref:Uncharacterized protein n=1 Tax=Halomonas casei TaxID=2742613 RepID=A0ABR9F664_9GAMM|nr:MULTISPECIES: hypothetical protein [Halomonas]MBE0401925.1 hypothetical protein [Halomonas casei]PCC20668.1 hypothetical protein CIK78_00415 [Halomonas sp. JB37]
MRLTAWVLLFTFSAALLATTGYVFADNHAPENEQHAPLNDKALEEEYGIKAGSVKRDGELSSNDAGEASDQTRAGEDDVELAPSTGEEESPGAGTGGTGSPNDAIHSSEEENNDNDDGTDDNE